MKFKNTCWLVLVFLLAVACSGENPTQFEIVPIKGDPLTFIKNTRQDSTSGLPLDLFEDDTKWLIMGRLIRREKRKTIDSIDQAKVSQAPPTSGNVQGENGNLVFFKMKQKPRDVSVGDILDFQSTQGFKFRFVKNTNSLNLLEVLNAQGHPAPGLVVRHYSHTPNKKAFSILISHNFGEAIEAMYFVKYRNRSILRQTLNAAYSYMFGPGVKVAHSQDRPLDLKICMQTGAMNDFTDYMENAIDRWRPALRDRLNIRTEYEYGQCPPFSDVNTKTISHIEKWVEVHGSLGTMASVFTVGNFYEDLILDSDLFVFESEWIEGTGYSRISDAKYRLRGQYIQTMTHECGHVLGLHHEFGENVESVMSYDNVDRVTRHDKDSVQELYPSL